METIKKQIVDAIHTAQTKPVSRMSIYSADDKSTSGYQNEMLLFIKPELTKSSDGKIDYASIVDMVFAQVEKFDMKILEIDLLGAQYLKDSGAIAEHYGVINKLSNDAIGSLSQSARESFKEIYGLPVDEAKPVGAFEFMSRHSFMTPDSMDMLWQNVQNNKLAGGTYCAPIKFDGQTTYLINGFHPRQLDHFILDGRSIVTFRVVTNTDWSVARNDFIGATNPAKANAGSLRSILLQNKDKLGLEEVSQGVNGIHLSAGPIEGLVELCRFSGLDLAANSDGLNQYIAGKALLEAFAPSDVMSILANVKLSIEGSTVSVFDATEEKNTADAVSILKKYIHQDSRKTA